MENNGSVPAVGQVWEHSSGDQFTITWAGEFAVYAAPFGGGERVKIAARRLRDEFRFIGMEEKPTRGKKPGGRPATRKPAPAQAATQPTAVRPAPRQSGHVCNSAPKNSLHSAHDRPSM